MHWKNNSGNIKFESAICNSIKSGSKLWCLGPASMQVQVSVHTVAQTASGIALSTGHLLYIRAKDTEPAIGRQTLNLLLYILFYEQVNKHLWNDVVGAFLMNPS